VVLKATWCTALGSKFKNISARNKLQEKIATRVICTPQYGVICYLQNISMIFSYALLQIWHVKEIEEQIYGQVLTNFYFFRILNHRFSSL
jgi:hypothetical protein